MSTTMAANNTSESSPSASLSTPIPVVLTFDDGPVGASMGGRTRTVLASLERRGFIAAFFVQTGVPYRMASSNGKTVVREILGYGHLVGIHTGTRPSAPGLKRDSKNQPLFDHRPFPERFASPAYDVTDDNVPDGETGLESDLIDAKQRLAELAGAPPKYVRATGGNLGKAETKTGIVGTFTRLHLLHIPWNLDSGDSWTLTSPDIIRDQLRKEAKKLALDNARAIVVLFHDIHSHTADHLDSYIETLTAGAREGNKEIRFTTSMGEIDRIFRELYGGE